MKQFLRRDGVMMSAAELDNFLLITDAMDTFYALPVAQAEAADRAMLIAHWVIGYRADGEDVPKTLQLARTVYGKIDMLTKSALLAFFKENLDELKGDAKKRFYDLVA